MPPDLVQRAQAQLNAQVQADPDLMTPGETGAELKVSEKTLANWRSGRRPGPPYVKLSGGIVRYSRRAVREWVAANTIDHGGAA